MHQYKTNIQEQKTPESDKSFQKKNLSAAKSVLQQSTASPNNLNYNDVIKLHNTIGNQKVGQLFKNQNQKNCIQKAENNTGIPDDVKTKMEGAFNTDFSNVRVHKSSSIAPKVGAIAFTQGSDIHFSPGQYNPSSTSGQKVLGHELTHVIQQRENKVKKTGSIGGFALNDSPFLEKQADKLGAKAAQMKIKKNK